MVAPIIADAKRAARRLRVVFLTNGDGGTAAPSVRNRESQSFLAALGVGIGDIVFLGEALSVSDGQLYRRLDDVHDALMQLLAELAPIGTIYVHAWEGGNPDHDAAHAIACGAACCMQVSDPVLQVPFYRAPRYGPLPFVLFAPLRENGPAAFYGVSLPDRLRRLAAIRHFPSQLRTFLVFLPLLVLDALFRPGVPIQLATPARLRERPMPSPLRYERIGYLAFSELAPFIERYWRRICSTARASPTTPGSRSTPPSEPTGD